MFTDDSIAKFDLDNLFKTGAKIIKKLYRFGILNEDYNFSNNKVVALCLMIV